MRPYEHVCLLISFFLGQVKLWNSLNINSVIIVQKSSTPKVFLRILLWILFVFNDQFIDFTAHIQSIIACKHWEYPINLANSIKIWHQRSYHITYIQYDSFIFLEIVLYEPCYLISILWFLFLGIVISTW